MRVDMDRRRGFEGMGFRINFEGFESLSLTFFLQRMYESHHQQQRRLRFIRELTLERKVACVLQSFERRRR